jgi:predicted peptidase
VPQQPQSIEVEITKRDRLNYLLFLPEGYDKNPAWPLILFLHGAGERGDDLDLVKKYGLPQRLEAWPDCPFVVVSPQCPAESYWTFKLDSVDALLSKIVNSYAVDPARIYLTGLSMGGLGAWLLAMLHPERFAAIAPVCGRSNRTTACLIKDIPVWVFHGAKDEVVPISESERMVTALQECGADVRFTVYPEAGHDSWTETYDNPELYAWFLKHRTR